MSSESKDNTANPQKTEYNVELLICGNQGVGKTCILYRFQDPSKEFQTSFLSTYGIDYKYKYITVFDEQEGKEVSCKCRIWDTAGQERYIPIAVNRFRSMHGIILVYDITDLKSFLSVETWIRQIRENTDSESEYPVQIVLVGNKTDCQERRIISFEQGQELANKFQVPFFEASAKTLQNLNTIFETLCVRCLPKSKYEHEKKSKSTTIKIVQQSPPRRKWKC